MPSTAHRRLSELIQLEPALLHTEEREALRVRGLAALVNGVTSAALAIVSKCQRNADDQQAQRLWQSRARIHSGLDVLERAAAKGRWLNTLQLSLADIAVACILGFINMRRVMPNWCVDHPALVAMAGRLFSRESFARTLPPAPPCCTASPIAWSRILNCWRRWRPGTMASRYGKLRVPTCRWPRPLPLLCFLYPGAGGRHQRNRQRHRSLSLPRAVGRRGADHSLEFLAADGLLEDGAGAGRRYW